MAISPTLNPELIVGNKKGSVGLAQKFITGGSLLGSSVVSSAANKIVGFQRNAAVRPNVPDVKSIIDLLSSSIVNNVDNSINQVVTNVNSNTDKKIQNVNKDFISSVNNIQNTVNKISLFRNNISQQENKIDQIFKTIEINKNEIINYIDRSKIESKKEFINEVTNIFDTRKIELIKDFQQNIIQSKTDLIERITSETEKIKQEIKNYTENINQITESKVINEITNKINENKTELINYIQNNVNNQDIIKATETRITNRIQQVENEIGKVRSEKLQSTTTQPNLGVVENEIQNTIKNVIENTRSTIENIQKQVSETLKTTIQNFTKRYDQKVKEVDDAKPVGILQRFISAYQSAIGFFKFFTDKTNLKRLRKGIESLKNSFSETYEVAKLTRQTIIKIIKQLSNLPKVSPSGGGGINLDVNIPGNPLRRAARPVARRMGFGKMIRYGAMGMGTVAAGGAVVNALSGTENIASSIGQQPEMPGSLVDKFSAIVDRFAKVIDSLSGPAKTGKSTGSPSDGPTETKSQQDQSQQTSPSSPSSAGQISVSGEGTPEQQGLLKALRYAEGTQKSYGTIFGGNVVKELEEGKLTVQEVIDMADSGKLPKRLGGRAIPGYGSGSKATGAYQFMPGTLENLIGKGVIKPNELFTNQVQDRAALSLASMRGVSADLLRKEGLSANVSNKLSPEWASFPTLSGKSYYGQPVKKLSDIQRVYNQSLKSQPSTITQKPQNQQIIASPSQQQTQQQIAQQVSQPPPTSTIPQTKPEVAVIPVPSGDSGGQQGSGIIPPAQQSGKQAEVGFFPPTNPDNFLVLYSRMIYNIVDG